MENRRYFVSRFVEEVIKPLSDLEYQLRVWIEGKGLECDSYDETINELVYFLEIIEKDPSSYGLSKEENNKILDFHKKIKEFEKENYNGGTDREIISSSSWNSVVEDAKEIRSLLSRYENLKIDE